jgi:hypothetical protein
MPKKPAAKPAAKAKPRIAAKPKELDPNSLVRREAGDYRTPDERFEVRTTGVGWMLLDHETTDDLGQPLIRGPYATRSAASEAIPEARRATIKELKRRR